MATDIKNVTLVAATVTTVTFAAKYSYIVIENLEETGGDTSIIYGTADGSAPTVAGDDCFAVDPGQSAQIANPSPFWWQPGYSSAEMGVVANPGTVIKLISAGTPRVSVQGTA
jgi:hypothetical protein